MSTISAMLDRQMAPAAKAITITPSDSTELNIRAVYVGGTGALSVTLKDDSAAVTFSAVPAGTLLPLLCKRVNATGTTATLIIGLI